MSANPDPPAKRRAWWETVTEAVWFKRVDDPRTRVGGVVTAVVALVFGVVAFVQNPSTLPNVRVLAAKTCRTDPLQGVYNPKRLEVLQACRIITGSVVHVSDERDGDLHIRLAVADQSLLTSANVARQHGDLVVEFMPGDPWRHVPLKIGDRLRLLCTYVLDHQHGGWAECHPVWSVQPLGAAAREVEP